MNRRELVKLLAASSAAVGAGSLMGCGHTMTQAGGSTAGSAAKAKVVVVGGGVGGISVAQSIKKADPNIEVTIVEKNRIYSTCFGSNWVLADIFAMKDITSDYNAMSKNHGINMVYDEVVGCDPVKKTVSLANGKPLEYDRLVVSPGISFRWDKVEGHDETTAHLAPHAYKAGYQTMQLKEQMDDMPVDGTMVMVAPPNPFRCPPGPYERASMVANFLQREKPKAKLIILDAKDKFSKFGLFNAGWETHYGYKTDNSIIDWVPKSKGGEVTALDPYNKVVTTATGDKIKADVINYIPAQKANMTAVRLGLTNESGWCPIDQETFESTLIPGIHVLGDASIASPMPKSGFSANSQGQVCGRAIAALLNGMDTDAVAKLNNQCYSLVTPDHGISVAAAYQLNDRKIGKTSGGLFPKDHTKAAFKAEAGAAHGWYAGMYQVLFK